MKIYSREEAEISKDRLFREIITGNLFIHPTDTIYGIGCNAMNERAVLKLRETKLCQNRPFSIMVPSKKWIEDNCEIMPESKEWLNKLPGPFTLVLKLKKTSTIAKSITLGGATIGVRIPDHWFYQFIKDIDTPLVTTSANIQGSNFMTSAEELDPLLEMKCSFMVDDGPLKGRPSTIVNLATEMHSIKKR